MAYEHLSSLDAEECVRLLKTHSVGRVAWAGSAGVLVLPVAYTLRGETVVFLTSPAGALAGLLRETAVSFEVDDIDVETRTGWNVLVQGVSGPAPEGADDLPDPWAPGERSLAVAITPQNYSGRAVAAG